MKDLIEALTILSKYGNPTWPTWCAHDVLHICEIDSGEVSGNDIKRLEELGFLVDEDDNSFFSFRYGSA